MEPYFPTVRPYAPLILQTTSGKYDNLEGTIRRFYPLDLCCGLELQSPFRRQAPSRRIALTTHGKDT